MQDNALKVVMSKGSMISAFGVVIKTTKGVLFCTHLKIREAAIAGANVKLMESMSITKAHRLPGHANEETSYEIALRLGWNINIDKMKRCGHCVITKAKQKNINKDASAKKA